VIEETRLAALLDDLSLGLVMAEPDNLISLGEILEKLENLSEALTGNDNRTGEAVLSGMRRAVEAVILERTPEKSETLDLVGRGACILQELKRGRTGDAEIGLQAEAFLNELKTRIGVDVAAEPALAPPEGSRPPETVPETVPVPEAADYEIEKDEDLFFGFVTESLEHIESIEVNIIGLEQEPEDMEILNAVFRPFHTIKGVSGFLNLKQIHRLTHDTENLLDDARNGRIKISGPAIDVVLDAVDILKRMVMDVKTSMESGRPLPEDYGLDGFIERLHRVREGACQAEEFEASGAEDGPYRDRKLGEILVEQGSISAENLDRFVGVQEDRRSRKLGDLAVEKGIVSREDLDEALVRQQGDQVKRIGEILIETGKAEPEDISQAVLEQESMREERLGEMLIREKQAGAREVAEALREQKRGGDGPAHTVKVDTGKLDGLVDLVGELVIAQSLVASNRIMTGLKDQKLARDLSLMARITSELQRTAMAMRMAPIRQTFQKMIRLVRDLSHKSGKPVELTLSGEETEIDRNMVAAIYDPLVHMVRNSVDHGIEPPEQRKARGKPIEGRVHLRAFHQGGNVVVEIEDDGQGLDAQKILAKAVERGLVGPDENLSEAAVYHLIFQPGFSTAEKVTDVSGRGVGMDVVKKAIDKLRGKVEISSKLGRGSTITIRLPLTLAIIDGMIVKVGDNRYILPTATIRESFRPAPGDCHTVANHGEMIRVRDSLLPLIRLDRVLGIVGESRHPAEALVVVVENDGRRRCLMVDQVIGKQEVVIKSLGESLKHIRSLAGGSILSDGRVGLILDVAGVFEVSDGMAGGA
jgi:two-component system chemotaxis sensor kinase CheA